MTINLIPPKLKKQKEFTVILGQIIFGFIAITVMLGVMSLTLFVYNSALKKDIAKFDDKLADQEKRLREYKSLETSIREANQRLEKISEVLPQRAIWSEIIAQISANTPKNLQVKTMDVNKDSSKVTISGVAATRKDIALFKERLEQNNFKNVTFTSSSYTQTSNDYTFSLSLELGVPK